MELESETAADVNCYSSNTMCTPTNVTTQRKCKETLQLKTKTELLQFVKQSRAQLKKLLEQLGWQEQSLQSSCKTVTEQPTISKHVTKIDEELLPTCFSTTHSVRLTAAETEQLLGNSFKYPGDACTLADLQINYTREQRLKIYEHILQRTTTTATEECNALKLKETLEMEPVTGDEDQLVPPKRRYRISRPTYREELHDLLEQQMRALTEKCFTGEQEEHQERMSAKSHKSERSRSRNRDKINSTRERNRNENFKYRSRHERLSRSKSASPHRNSRRKRSNSRRNSRSLDATSYKNSSSTKSSYKSTKIVSLHGISHTKQIISPSRRERSRSRSRRKRSKSHEMKHRKERRHRSRSKHNKN